MQCPVCSGSMIETQATSFGDKYWYCRACKKELAEMPGPIQTCARDSRAKVVVFSDGSHNHSDSESDCYPHDPMPTHAFRASDPTPETICNCGGREWSGRNITPGATLKVMLGSSLPPLSGDAIRRADALLDAIASGYIGGAIRYLTWHESGDQSE